MANININIDGESIQKSLNTLGERLKQLSGYEVFLVILAIVMPPVAAFLKVGLSTHFWINIILTILGMVPGQIHALWLVMFN